jgi:hypothetical protein
MRRLICLSYTIVIITGTVFAQMPDPANYHVIFGNRDGSPMSVPLGAEIEVPIWIATDPNPGSPDTLEYVANPLASNDSFIISRNNVFAPDQCDRFFDSMSDSPGPGYTTQIHSRSSLQACRIFTMGDTILIATFQMTTTSNTAYLYQTVCPFMAGGIFLWGMQDEMRNVIPTQTYGCLYFSSVAGIAEETGIPRDFSLSQNYPNPFNPTTIIRFSLSKDCPLKLTIYNVLGQRAATLLNGLQFAGEHNFLWDASSFPSGLYFARLEAGEESQTVRMMLLK